MKHFLTIFSRKNSIKKFQKIAPLLRYFFPSKTALIPRKKKFGFRKKKRVEKRNALATRFFFRQIIEE